MEKESSTQNFVPIKEIRDGVVILKNGQLCSILLASSINFSLKSNTEQEAILAGFQSFLNTIDFSLQIYVQSRKMDIRPYLELLASRESAQYNDLMRIQLREYIDFIRTFTAEAEIMSKNFFVVVPYAASKLDTKGIRSLLGTKKKGVSIDLARFEEDRTQLDQRVAVVEHGLSRIGVRTIPLGTDEAVELFYHIYNPEETSKAPER
jgi:type IV secretory pathway VirB4 component